MSSPQPLKILFSCFLFVTSSLWAQSAKIEPDMVTIPAGKFFMGEQSNESGKDEVPVHPVSIKSFKLAKTEITVGQYRQFVLATGYVGGSSCWGLDAQHNYREQFDSWKSPSNAPADDHPATCINWNDAKAYVNWLVKKTGKKYRLPTESEWEYAARASTTTQYYFGREDAKMCSYGNLADATGMRRFGWSETWGAANCTDSASFTTAVAQYKPNAFGLYDMIGNVYEWTEDCYHETYDGAPTNGIAWTSGDCKARVLRGGSWFSRPVYVRSAARTGDDPVNRDTSGGFRLAQDL